MGFNKCFVPSMEYIQKILLEHNVEYVVKLFGKCDCMIGNSDAIELIGDLMTEYYKPQKNDSRAPEPGNLDTRVPRL